MRLLWIIELEEPKFHKRKNNNKKTYQGENISMEDSGLSKREWNELMEAFDLKDKQI